MIETSLSESKRMIAMVIMIEKDEIVKKTG